MNVNYINPFITATTHVFKTVLDCDIRRQHLSLKQTRAPTFEVSGVIGLTGKANGAVALSVSKPLAFKLVEVMLETRVHEINSDVADAVGELTNMIAGGAKTGLSHYELSLGLPTVFTGRSRTIDFPASVSPLCVLFETLWGPMAVEVGLNAPRSAGSADNPPRPNAFHPSLQENYA
ncbi:MAG TPA: chemotaxis protein CheX [Pirellulales bacterium]|nr:chemotaxis protein CheX [Pirellulales bacterium]